MKHWVDNLDKVKTGHTLFAIGLIGFMASGACIDSALWYIALIGVIASVLIAWIGYQIGEIGKEIHIESHKVLELKNRNRNATYMQWLKTTKMP